MPLLSAVKMLMRFSDTSLLDDISGNQFKVKGDDSVISLDSTGIQLKINQYLYMDNISLGVTNNLGIGFWLYSKHPGVTDQNGTPKNMQVSVLDFGIGSFDTVEGDVSITTQVVRIYEEAQVDGTMKLVFSMPSNSFTAKTESYTANKRHYFWIAYNGSTLKIFVDAIDNSISTSGSVPSSISASTVILSINRLSSSGNILNNNGVLDDLIIVNTFVDSALSMQNIVNYSLDMVFNTDYASIQEADLPLLFDDPTPIRINDTFSDGPTVLVARNDGKLLQGSSLVWDVRRDFSNKGEQDVSNVFGSDIGFEDNYLRVKNGIIKL